MRDPIENVSLLQKQLNDLQLENQILKEYFGPLRHFVYARAKTITYT